MPRNLESPALAPADDDAVETEMRRALGLHNDAPRRPTDNHNHNHNHGAPASRMALGQKRRFVQDGEVPVVLMHGRRDNGLPSNRLEHAETALRTERTARETAERALSEAQASIRELQTRIGHAQLAGEEAAARARRAEEEKQAAVAELAGEIEARIRAEQALERAHEAASERALELANKRAAERANESREIAEPPREIVRRGPRKARPVAMMPEAEPELELMAEAEPEADAEPAPASPLKLPRVARVPSGRKPGRPPKLVNGLPKPAKEPKPIRWWIKTEKTKPAAVKTRKTRGSAE